MSLSSDRAPDQGRSSPEPAASGRARSRRHHGKDTGYVGQASWQSSVINLLNTIVGAGTLAMPLAMSHTGMTLGVMIIVWSGMTAGLGLYLQAKCARYLERGSASFFALSQITYPNVAVVFDAAIAIKCFGVGVSYLIIIGDLMPGVAVGFNADAANIPLFLDRKFWITAFMLICVPLAFIKKLDTLRYTSVIALISITYLVVLVVYHFGLGDTMDDRGPIRYVETAGIVPVLSSFPVIVFAFTCHQNMFSVLNEIKDNSHFQTTSTIVTSIGTAAGTYILVAITGYLSFGNGVNDNIVSMYLPSIASTIGKFAIVILVMFSYPLQTHPCRNSVDAVIKWRPQRSAEASPSRGPLLPNGAVRGHGQKKGEQMGETRFAVITTVVVVLSYLVAITVSSLSTVLAYVGSTGSTSISFILPGLMYYKISAPDSPHHQRLLKEDDDEDEEDEEDEEGGQGQGQGQGEGLLGGGMHVGRWLKRSWARGLLRKLSLALAIYGVCVMVVCLITTTVFHAQH